MKSNLKYYTISIAVFLCLTSCSKAQETIAQNNKSVGAKKILIVYLSRTRNTKAVAEMIHQQIGGDLVALELQNPYPENYQQIVAQVAKENETGFLPPLKTKIDSIATYDVIYLGFPTWGMQLPPPIKSFLKDYNLGGKTIVPFNTNAGYGIGSSFDTVKKLCPGSTILEGFSIKGGIERDGVLFVMEGEKKVEAQKKVQQWLTKIGAIAN
ncbi:flavodoxin family protein [Flavobacterium subsaxonicum]|uniref:Flavodoxin n=1 Tax=Flavobacterium subsaxonicum WB 4.1-42 = DSM 21790 TaxID=1121898 RepID=A0A0A2MFA8_9FLAO|nr:flavodoxin [Flavobacterium subsaxonicum]KGO90974.1 flavodoxin [Flavobacterium subsaxonicum WB 4.1-42 = DSM 21790]